MNLDFDFQVNASIAIEALQQVAERCQETTDLAD